MLRGRFYLLPALLSVVALGCPDQTDPPPGSGGGKSGVQAKFESRNARRFTGAVIRVNGHSTIRGGASG